MRFTQTAAQLYISWAEKDKLQETVIPSLGALANVTTPRELP